MDVIQNLDVTLLMFIQKNLHTPLLDKVMPIITSMGNGGLIWILICILLLLNKKYRKVGLMMGCAIILTAILGEGIIKHLVKRPRPCALMTMVDMLVKAPKSYSFPSGHSSASFAAATILFINFKKYGRYALLLAVLIAFSRLYVFVHYPSDVLTGICLGTISALFVNYIFKTRYKKLWE